MSKPTVLSILGRNPSYVGGMELYCRELSRQLSEAGWRSVVAFSAPPSPAVARLLDLPDTEVVTLPDPCAPTAGSVRGFLALMRRFRPRIVHTHFTPLVGPYPWLARLAGARQVWFTDHSSRPANHVIQPASAKCRLAWRALNAPVTGIVCPSRFGLRCMQGLDALPPERLHLVYNGADLERAARGAALREEARKRLSIPPDALTVLQVSWMVPEKGWPDLLEAAHRVRPRVPALHLVLVGDGPERTALQRQACDLGLDDCITWAGVVDDPLGTGTCAAADVVCQPSRHQELFGLTIAEGMAAGRPVVATGTGGIPELVEDGVTGRLAPPGDVAGLAQALADLLADAATRARMGAAAREAVFERFDLRANVPQLAGLYGAGA